MIKGFKNFRKEFRIIKKNTKILNERLHSLEGFTSILAIKFKEYATKHPMTLKERSDLAGMLSIKWGKTEDKTLNA